MVDDPDHPEGREGRLCEVLAAYFEAVEAGRAPERGAWLAEHPDLADDLAAFLEEQDRFLGMTEPLRLIVREAEGGVADGPTAAPGPVIGGYLLLGEIDRGGVGVVYRARQRGLNRVVALKMLRDGALADGDDLRRFRVEAEAVAQLDHPNIVPVYEVGEQDGFSFLAMKLIEGGSLARQIGEQGEDPRTAARLLATVARAIHHAHRRGILHRDLKPSNILVDEEGQPHVTDFGLARRVEGDSDLTRTGAIVGTASYMAPEQAEGRRGGATVATDVYGLGAVLYTLLARRPPFRGDSVLETLDLVRREAPAPLVGAGLAVDRDLNTICLKCLEKEAAHRYDSALAVAEDLERWLRGEPIAARPAGRLGRARRWCRRHPMRTGFVAAGLLVLGLSGVTAWEVVERREAQDRAERTAREVRRREDLARRGRYIDGIHLASRLLADGQVAAASAELDRWRPTPGAGDLRDFAWSHLRTLLHREQATLAGHRGEVYHAEFSPDGRTLATCGQDRTARLWDVATTRERATLAGHEYEVNWVTFSPDGRTLATASDDGTIRLWDAADGRGLGEVGRLDRPAVAVVFTPDGRSLISGGRDHKVRRWDVAARREVASWDLGVDDVESLAIAAEGTSLAVAGHHPTAWIVDWSTGRAVAPLHGYGTYGPSPLIAGIALSRDGKFVAATAESSRGRLWDADGARRAALIGHHDTVMTLAFAPDGRALATGCRDATVRLWEVPTGTPRDVLMGHADRVWGVAFAPDGHTLATASRDGTSKLWDTARRPDRVALPGLERLPRALAYTSDASRLIAVDGRGAIVTWDVATGVERDSRGAMIDAEILWNVAIAEPTLAADFDFNSPGRVGLRALRDDRRDALIETGQREIDGLAMSRDGAFLATLHGGLVLLWDVATGGLLGRIELGDPGQAWLTFGPRGDVLAIGFWNKEGSRIGVWELAARRWRTPPAPTPYPVCLAASHDGSLLACVVDYYRIQLRGTASPAERGMLTGHAGNINAADFSPDGRTLASGGADKTVRLWDVATGRELLTLEGHTAPVTLLRFAPDGKTLASAADSLDGRGEVLLWRTADPDSR